MNPVPTPTPYAYETIERITALEASDYSIWNFADDAVNVWNYNPVVGQVFQTVIIVILVIAFVILFTKLLQMIMSER